MGLQRGISDIGIHEIDMIDPSVERGVGYVPGKSADTIQFWLENVRIGMPTKSQSYGTTSGGGGGGGAAALQKSMKLYPRECRELGIMYAAPITGEFCYQFVKRIM